MIAAECISLVKKGRLLEQDWVNHKVVGLLYQELRSSSMARLGHIEHK